MSDGARVIVGVSGSLHSLTALHRAAEEARIRQAVLVPVLAWTPVGGERNYRARPCPPLLRAWQDLADARMERALEQAFGGLSVGVPVRPLVVRGEAGAVLAELADRPGDLLVVSTGAQGGLRARVQRLTGRSVTRHCLDRARCGVLVVPPSTLHEDLRALHRGIDLRELVAA
ncbi:universal stress protein family protein [Streptomyces sp. 1114.5]|uniref:universal stress protein n=1 Tax=Streptomyces sp. 1114.5 TaxID=1938830 RepID=UPI000EB2E4CD|nr:universal stress protein [Streptomyces sp. 1114.5]RKT12048.1 universal stress protein family protein [Streptomyces sp. 1114.5]